MGMEQAFSPAADFSKMTGGRDLYISQVVHKAYVDVNEEGTSRRGDRGRDAADRHASTAARVPGRPAVSLSDKRYQNGRDPVLWVRVANPVEENSKS
jgi:hypothetical protein